jgi:hypothetical protein
MNKFTDLPETKLAITHKLPDCAFANIIRKVNELIDKINFLDEHVNFLYERSRTQYNTLVSQGKGLQNVYDEFQEFKKRFAIYENQKQKNKEIESSCSKLDLIRLQDNN